MGGSWKDALEVPLDTFHRYIAFADVEEDIKRKKAEADASAKQQ